MLDNTPNQPTKFRTNNWVEINDESRGTYNTKSQIKFNTSMLRSSLCDYSDAYILVSGNITPVEVVGGRGNNGIQVVFKNHAPFTNCISEVNNTQIDNAKDIDVVMPMYNLIEYSNNYSKTSRSLWKYYRHEPALNDAGTLANFPGINASFKYKQKITGSTANDGRKVSNFWRTLEIP